MLGFVIRRLLWLIPVLWFVATITFALMHMVPGGPWDREKKLPEAMQRALNERYGLDQPLAMQYVSYLANAVRGDLGLTYSYQDRPVADVIREGFPVTATLGAAGLFVALGLGITLGVLAALRPNSPLDYASIFFATLGASAPSFVIGILLVIVFAVLPVQFGFKLLPTGGWGTPDKIILPALALGLFPAAFLARMTRSAMLEVLGQDFIRTARSKGLSARVVVMRHALKNALIPVLTVAGPLAAHMAVGSFIIESLFTIPGIGRLYVTGIFQRDYGLIMGATLFYAFAVAVANLAVDVMYALVDPRIRYR